LNGIVHGFLEAKLTLSSLAKLIFVGDDFLLEANPFIQTFIKAVVFRHGDKGVDSLATKKSELGFPIRQMDIHRFVG